MPGNAVQFHYAARSDVGLVRSNNQDSGYAGANLLVLADGMGGPAGGDIASSVALAHLVPLDTDSHPADSMLPLGEAPIVIGRSPACTLVLEDEYASSRHAALTPQSDGWWIEDLSSRNGTFIDDERLNTPRQLKVGDIIRIGQTTLELVG